jgi:hypothetical protein
MYVLWGLLIWLIGWVSDEFEGSQYNVVAWFLGDLRGVMHD